MSEYNVITQSYVSVVIEVEGREYGVEKRYSKDIRIGELKNKLEMITGLVANSNMKIRLLSREKKFVCDLEPDDKMLGYFPAEDGYILEVLGSRSMLDDVNNGVGKFELSEEEYAKRKNTMKEFKQRNKLGQFSDDKQDIMHQKEEQNRQKLEAEQKLLDRIQVNARCQVRLANAPTRLGTVMYLGELSGKSGKFVGVKYDEPLGKNDGSVDGKRYFQCLPNYGGFVKPDCVTVGDFPEESLDEI